ncbi:MAG: VanW family protein [Polyangiales bacterium]
MTWSWRTYGKSALMLGALLLAAALVAWAGLGTGVWHLPNIHLAGLALPAEAELPAALRRKANAWGEQSLEVRVGYHVFQPTRAELGFGLQVEDADAALRGMGRSLNPLVTWHALWVGLFAGGHELDWRPRLLNQRAFDHFVETLRARVERLPVAGSFGPQNQPIEGLPGEAFDAVAARRAIERALARADDKLVIATLVTPPPRGYRRFNQPLVATNTLMYQQETSFTEGTGRATNIMLAARLLDGYLLQPGAAFSFNEVVGRRDRKRGFAAALELVAGELVEGVGGGVCQVAGTLHAAAFFAGLVVDEYHAHSRLSRLAYLPPGLDAMVAWPDGVTDLRETRDMRLRNPYPFPVRISARIDSDAGRGVLVVALYGAAPPFHVAFDFDELERVPAGEIQRVDAALRPGETRVQQSALAGLVITRRRTIYTPKGKFTEQTRVAYPPTPRIVLVGATRR